jgi:hypothetical protein
LMRSATTRLLKRFGGFLMKKVIFCALVISTVLGMAQAFADSPTCSEQADSTFQALLANSPTGTADERCFSAYSSAASQCNSCAGDDDNIFDSCLSQVKTDLTSCCQTLGGSPACANP